MIEHLVILFIIVVIQILAKYRIHLLFLFENPEIIFFPFFIHTHNLPINIPSSDYILSIIKDICLVSNLMNFLE
jgi:hypothetical protein